MFFRLILPEWACVEYPDRAKVLEGKFCIKEIEEHNKAHYNCYFWPNNPDNTAETPIAGHHIHTFEYVFVDMDLKDGTYKTKEEFLSEIDAFPLAPTSVVDSGNGIHVYWHVSDLDAKSYLKLQRRLCRKFKTDDAVSKLAQLMRLPNTINTKLKDEPKLCAVIHQSQETHTSEQLDRALPPLTSEDAAYCEGHYNKTYNPNELRLKVEDKLPSKFGKLMAESQEVRDIWMGKVDDRSKADYRLGHIMCAAGFTKAEALSVLINAAKGMNRTAVHRVGYAEGIVDKIWTYEDEQNKEGLSMSSTVREILARSGDSDQMIGTRFACHKYIDNTHTGFRLGHVIGLVGGSGVGKSAVALNLFEGFVQNNPDYEHFFIPLEQPVEELAGRWKALCGERTHLHDKVHLLSNYAPDGTYRNLTLKDIKDYLIKFQTLTGKKIGCVVIDHIGALKKKGKDGENQGLMEICQEMKAFAVQTNTLLVMQSQAPREKAGIGDLELNKDAAYGTVYFESFVDYLITMWQPVKRCYADGAPTVTAFKFCKIRHKYQGVDVIQEDVCYRLFFEAGTGRLRELTQKEAKAFSFFLSQAANIRKQDRKTDVGTYVSTTGRSVVDGKTHNDQDLGGAGEPNELLN